MFEAHSRLLRENKPTFTHAVILLHVDVRTAGCHSNNLWVGGATNVPISFLAAKAKCSGGRVSFCHVYHVGLMKRSSVCLVSTPAAPIPSIFASMSATLIVVVLMDPPTSTGQRSQFLVFPEVAQLSSEMTSRCCLCGSIREFLTLLAS